MEFEIKHISKEDFQKNEARKAKLIKEANNKSPGKYLLHSIFYGAVGALFTTPIWLIPLGEGALYMTLVWFIPIGALSLLYAAQQSYRSAKYSMYKNRRSVLNIFVLVSSVMLFLIDFLASVLAISWGLGLLFWLL